ncbi:hypothetical protein [Flavicella sediminum]|uniref:hypothetical protein n=1 Tax=Flavicella sediminum TaxID=2585141 RepID=UPI0011245EA9|nr:hypothetical protein [Flavicella sediminum]
MKKLLEKDIIPLLISIIILLTSIGISLSTNYNLNYKHYAGIALIGISTILYFTSKKTFPYLFGLIMFLGTINLIDIFIMNITFGNGLIKLNPIFLILLIVFMILDKELWNKIFPKKSLIEKQISENQNMIKKFEIQFESKSESELNKIADEKSGYVNEARIASKNILRDKYVL